MLLSVVHISTTFSCSVVLLTVYFHVLSLSNIIIMYLRTLYFFFLIFVFFSFYCSCFCHIFFFIFIFFLFFEFVCVSLCWCVCLFVWFSKSFSRLKFFKDLQDYLFSSPFIENKSFVLYALHLNAIHLILLIQHIL